MSGVILKQGLMEVNPELHHYLEGNESFNGSCFFVDIHDYVRAVGVDNNGYTCVFAGFGVLFSVRKTVNHGFKFIQRFAGNDKFKGVVAGPFMVFIKGCFELVN